MGDPAPTERPTPVGFGFRPYDRELVGHYLYRKLMADDPSIHDTIPEIGVCKYEPRDLLAWAASASSTKFDDFQCYFFSPHDYKYCNGKQFNRTTSRGFWKVTGRDRKITDGDTNNVIGTKKTLVFYEGRIPYARKTYWVIHEYHDAQLPSQQRTHVLCWLKKNDEKKRKEKIYQIKDFAVLQNENQRNVCINLEEHGSLNTKSMIQPSFQLNEATDSMIQPSFQLNEATDSMIQPSYQLNEATDSMIQSSFQLIKTTDSMIQPSFHEVTDSMIQLLSKFTETIDSMIQPSSQLNEAADSMIQPSSQLNKATDSMIQPLFYETTDSMIQLPSKFTEVTNLKIQSPSQLNNAQDSTIQTTF